MKTFFKTIALSAVTLAFLAPNVAKAEEMNLTPNVTETQEMNVRAAGWQNLGTWSMKNGITFRSDGGNLKVCVAGSDVVEFNLVKDAGIIVPGTVAETTGSNTAGKNCAEWSGLSAITYKLYKNSHRDVYHSVTVYD